MRENRLIFWVIFSLLLGLGACRSSKNQSSTKIIENQAEGILKKAKKQIGTRYKSGGDSPSEGFDCSGFTRYCFESEGIKLPATASQQVQVGIKVNPENAQKADLIFFKGGDKKSKSTGHVGIVIGGKGNDLEFIHASTSKGIMVSKLSEKYFKERFVGIRRVVGVVHYTK